MEHQDKLYEQFKDAAHKEEQKDFARMEAVWNRVEEKLDRKEERRAAAWWKYTGIAAALLLFMSLGYILMQNDKHPLPNVSPSNQQVTTTTAIDTQKVQETVRPLKEAVTSAEIDTQAVKETVKPLKANSTVAYEHTYLKKISEIEADSIQYDPTTKKARVWNSRTDKGEFRVKAEITKKEGDDTYFMRGARFTTSKNVDNPEYYFSTGKIKLVPGSNTKTEEVTPLVNAAPALNNNRLNTAVGDPSALYSNSLNKPGDKAYPFKEKDKEAATASSPASSALDEVVVVGYGTQKKQQVTAATTTVTSKTIEGRPNASFVQSLQGQVPGLNVTTGNAAPGNNNSVASNDYNSSTGSRRRGEQMASFKTNAKDKAVVDNTPRNSRDGDINTEVSNSLQGRAAGVNISSAAGQPGSGNTTVILRGAGTINGNPLYIIDGVPANADNMKSIDPNNIESVSVIKDGATDIFGSRGANGVIVVTTKESKKMSKRQFRKLQKKRYEQWQKENTPSVIIRDAAAPTSDPKAQTEKQEEKIPVDTEEYEAFEENKFESPASNPLSTFSIDVDNASYTNVRRFINNAQVVPKDAVRVEEMINFFKYNYPQPSSVHPFSINTEYSDCPWNPKHKLLKIGLQGKDIPARELPASNFVFLIDVSGSMNEPNKLPLLKESMKILVKNMRREDRIAIVVYAGAAGLVLPATRGDEKETIISALNKLNAGGSTAGGEGIELAYKIAQENFVKGGNNRVILATDGDFNVGRTSNTDMQTLIEEKRKSGVFLTCLGYGMGNYKDSKLETLSDKGNGNYAYIDNMQEADRFLDKEFKGSMYAIAKDVKIQIEFNPSHVQAYRLIGYENRKLRDEDFANDAIDAGELGSGHTVTALYEIIPPGVENDFVTTPELKYSQVQQNGNQYSSELATIKFRYKKPDGDKSTEIVQTIADTAVPLAVASGDFKFAAAVAWFGLKLRDSKLVPNKNVEAIKKLATEGILTDPEGYRAEFIRLVNRIE